jgi:uncharacterized membrane protein YfcA
MVGVIEVILVSLAAGFLGSLTGLGGASVTIPLLVLLGVPVKHAIASSLISVIATSTGSSSSFVTEGVTNLRAAMFLECFTITGAVAGAFLTVTVSPAAVALTFSAVMIASLLLTRVVRSPQEPGSVKQDKFSSWLGLEGSYFDPSLGKEVSYKLTNALSGGLAMVWAGAVAGMLGIGAGAFKVAIHETVLKMPTKVSTSTSNLIMGMTALAGAGVYVASGLMVLDLAAPMALGTTLGSALGSRLLTRMRDVNLRRLYFALAAVSASVMLYRALVLGV